MVRREPDGRYVEVPGRPHALPVWGVWDDDDGRFAFSAGPRARKVRNLAANPQAVVMIDDTVECVSIEGSAAPVTDEARLELETALRHRVPIIPSSGSPSPSPTPVPGGVPRRTACPTASDRDPNGRPQPAGPTRGCSRGATRGTESRA